MSRRLRLIAIALAVLLALVAAAGWVAASYFSRERVTALVAAEVKRASGRELHIDGAIGLHLLPLPTLRLEGLRLSNADWGTRPEMLTVRRLELDVALWPLLQRRLQIRRMQLDGIDLWLETDASGRGNWQLQGEATPPSSDPGSSLSVDLDRLAVADSVLTWRQAGHGDGERVELKRLLLRGEGDATRVEAEWRLRGETLTLRGSTGRLGLLTSAAERLPLDLTLALDGARVQAQGEVGLGARSGSARLKLTAQVRQTDALGRLAGARLALPLPLDFSGTLDQQGGVSLVPDLQFAAAGQSLAGRLRYDAGDARQHPKLAATLKSDALDLAAWLPPAKAAPRTPPGSKLFNDAPLPWPAAPALESRIEIEIAQLRLPGQPAPPPLASVRATLATEGGQLGLQPITFAIAGGSVSAQATLRRPPGGAPALKLQGQGQGLALEPLLAMAKLQGHLGGGRTDLRFDLGASGESLHQLARTLAGEVRVEVGRARLSGRLASLGGDLATRLLDALNPGYKPDQGTEITCIAMRLPIRAGVIDIDRSIGVETDRLDVVVSGRIDLGAERVDLGFRPTVKQGLGIGAGNLAQLVRLQGSLSDPGIGVDIKGAAREAVSIGAAFATSGLSLLGERLLRSRAQGRPCQEALARR